MTLDINKLEAAAKAATQGEWVSNANGAVRTVGGDDSTRGRSRWQGVFRQVDADFIAATNPQAVIELITRLRDAEKDAVLYKELIYAVARKFPDETRHQTAHRYIKCAEAGSYSNAAMKESV